MEMVYGIYWGNQTPDYYYPERERVAQCIINENQSDKEIIDHLIAADFLSQHERYEVQDMASHIYIFAGRRKLKLVLIYEEDVNQKIERFKELEALSTSPEELLENLTSEGYELEDIIDIALRT